jgi:hypothetical protein
VCACRVGGGGLAWVDVSYSPSLTPKMGFQLSVVGARARVRCMPGIAACWSSNGFASHFAPPDLVEREWRHGRHAGHSCRKSKGSEREGYGGHRHHLRFRVEGSGAWAGVGTVRV